MADSLSAPPIYKLYTRVQNTPGSNANSVRRSLTIYRLSPLERQFLSILTTYIYLYTYKLVAN